MCYPHLEHGVFVNGFCKNMFAYIEACLLGSFHDVHVFVTIFGTQLIIDGVNVAHLPVFGTWQATKTNHGRQEIHTAWWHNLLSMGVSVDRGI